MLPRRTIGWHIIAWIEEWLIQPDGPKAGEPFRLTEEQMRWLLWWYSIDERGRFIYRTGMLRRMKGWGKDPLAVALCCAEFLGPCRFAGWDTDGEPLTEPHYSANVQIAAVSLDQVKRNTMSLFPVMFSRRALEEYDVDLGKEIIYANAARARLELLTTSARSAEGPRPTFILRNETQHWLSSNGGYEMAAVCARNAAKSRDGSTRTLAISNAHAPGELSDAELDYEAYIKGDPGFLYDSLEAGAAVVEALNILTLTEQAAAEEARLREILRVELVGCRGDSVWLDIDRLLEECLAPKTPVNEALRFYFNRLAASEERAFRVERFRALAVPSVGGRLWRPEPGVLITLGFDGSVNDDRTALIGTDILLGRQWVAGSWAPRQDDLGEWKIDVNEVDTTVAEVMREYEVWRMNCDPYYWMEWISAWAGRYNRPGHEVVVSQPTTNLKTMALATIAYRNAIDTGEITHDGHPRLVEAIANSHKRMLTLRDDKSEPMFVLQKERPGSPLKIDEAMAAILSWWGRLAAIAAGVKPKGPSVYERRGVRRL